MVAIMPHWMNLSKEPTLSHNSVVTSPGWEQNICVIIVIHLLTSMPSSLVGFWASFVYCKQSACQIQAGPKATRQATDLILYKAAFNIHVWVKTKAHSCTTFGCGLLSPQATVPDHSYI